MKHIHLLLIALCCGVFTACMNGNDGLTNDDWTIPELNGNVFGNPNVKETNLVTIAQLKQQYATVISEGGLQKFTKATQIKGVVTGNDIEGNVYSEVAIDDGTGAILICISQGGLFAQLPVGQEILVELKDLYIGSYGQQPEIGTPYTNKNGRTYVSRMSRALWADHFTYTGQKKEVAPVEFDKTKVSDAKYIEQNCGKLMTIKGVKFESVLNNVYANEHEKDAANCVNRSLEGISNRNLVVRTSTYADFAALALPEGTCDITGIFTRYNNTWQILIRQISDVVVK
jgi:hypothetical protein